jgi:hypothetical protein
MFNALKSSAMVLGVALAMGTAGVETASAQDRSGAQPGGRPAPADPQRRAPTEQEIRAVAGPQVLQFQPAPNMALGAVQGVNAALMQGWTPVTTGATLGGPSIVKLSTGHRLVVRAANSVLHDAPIDVVNQSAPLPGSAWRSLSISATSEPYCVFEDYTAAQNYFCAYLTTGGAAAVSRITGGGSGQSWPMGGSNGSGRVTMGGTPYSGYVGSLLETGFSLLVWDGGTRLFARTYRLVAGPSVPAAEQGLNQGWRALQGAYQGPVSCTIWAETGDVRICAQGTGTGVRLLSEPWSPAALTGTLPPTLAVTQPTPGPIAATPPEIVATPSHYVVVVRGQDGAIHQARRPRGGGNFGPWISEGGSAREGSGISCTAVNEQPICFIQGTDGRIYRKALSTASGL